MIWDIPEHKPFYKRWWFIIPAAILLVALLIAAFYALRLRAEYKSKAEEYSMQRLTEMESASLIYDRNGELLGRIFIQNRRPVTLEQLPKHFAMAVVAAEDERFYRHDGVDLIGTIRAALANWRAGRIRQGASTITMQLARNTFKLHERSYERKAIEAMLAFKIEEAFTKKEILELYINRVYYGYGLYGVEAAARGYFGKSARDLTLSEAAMLAGILRSPNNLSPWRDRRAARGQRDLVLKKMRALQMIGKEEYEAAIEKELPVKNRKPLLAQSYALDYIRNEVMKRVGKEGAASGGYKIHTTIDARLQRVADKALQEQLVKIEEQKDYKHETYTDYLGKRRRWRQENPEREVSPPPRPNYLQGAFIILENETGATLAISGGRNFQHSQFNRALSARRPSGTAFLPIVYAAAYEAGFFGGTILHDTAMNNRQVMIGGTTGILGEWGPEKADNRYESEIPAQEALLKSKNAASVRLGMRTGLERVLALAKKAGITTPLREFPATFLGASEGTLAQLTQAYTMFAEAGQRPAEQFVIGRIVTPGGYTIWRAQALQQPVIKPGAAYQVHESLAKSLEIGTADKATTLYGLRQFPAAGKTGTAYGFTDVWFLGYTSEITCGVWAGFDQWQKTIYRGAFSSDIVLPVWVEIMNAAAQWYPPQSFPKPETLKPVEICESTGLIAGDNCFEKNLVGLTGQVQKKSTTFTALVTDEQVPPEICVHGKSLPLWTQRKASEGEWPKAVAAVDPERVQPVNLRGPTVIGEDPYRQTEAAADPFGIIPQEAGGEEKQVMRAEPVRPFDQPLDEPILTIKAPDPIDFN